MSFAKQLREKRDARINESQNIIATAEADKRELTTEEDTRIGAILDEVRSLDTQITNAEEVEKRAAEAAEARKPIENEVRGGAVVRNEARTYRPNGENDFIADAFRAQILGSYEARERIARHQQEEAVERRAVGTSAFSGLVVPQYLVDLVAPYARAGRPFLDGATVGHGLPDEGMTIYISRITTGSSTAVQSSENSAVSETNMDDTLLSVPVITVAGQQTVSRQSLERGTNIEQIVMGDLVRAWHTSLDSQAILGSGSSGQAKGIYTTLDGGANEITYTDASPTVAELYPKLADAIQRVQAATFQQPTHWVMAPRRLAWFLSSLDGQNRPLVVPTANGPMNALSTGDGAVRYANSGYSLMGLPIITDGNVQLTLGSGTNEDVIYCVNGMESHLWEAPGHPMMLNFEQPNAASLGVLIVVYGYAAYTAERYGAVGHSMITGTGLAAPSF
jgi:HK97 family phage major capsid protein